MICVETIGKIRRWHRVNKLSVSEIARRLSASRNTSIEGDDWYDETKARYLAHPFIDIGLTGKVTNAPEANEFLSRKYREGWVLNG